MTNTETDRRNMETALDAVAAVGGNIPAAIAAITLTFDELVSFGDMIHGGFQMPRRYQATARESIIASLCERWVDMTGCDVV